MQEIRYPEPTIYLARLFNGYVDTFRAHIKRQYKRYCTPGSCEINEWVQCSLHPFLWHLDTKNGCCTLCSVHWNAKFLKKPIRVIDKYHRKRCSWTWKCDISRLSVKCYIVTSLNKINEESWSRHFDCNVLSYSDGDLLYAETKCKVVIHALYWAYEYKLIWLRNFCLCLILLR